MNALKGFIGSREREQTVWTPESILDAVDKVFPDGWGDVFPSEGSPASRRARLTRETGFRDALNEPWHERNYANPEYKTLAAPLAEAYQQWKLYDRQSVLLVPVRTRRAWWCGYVEGACVAYLRPFAFLDAATGKPYVCVNKKTGKATVSQFPENLAAVYWGDRKALFMDAFADLATHMQERF